MCLPFMDNVIPVLSLALCRMTLNSSFLIPKVTFPDWCVTTPSSPSRRLPQCNVNSLSNTDLALSSPRFLAPKNEVCCVLTFLLLYFIQLRFGEFSLPGSQTSISFLLYLSVTKTRAMRAALAQGSASVRQQCPLEASEACWVQWLQGLVFCLVSRASLSNPQPAGHMLLRTALNVVQRKFVNFHQTL